MGLSSARLRSISKFTGLFICHICMIFIDLMNFCAIFYLQKEENMTEEPTLLSQILCIIFWLFITGGFIFFLCLLNYIFKHAKCNPLGKYIPM